MTPWMDKYLSPNSLGSQGSSFDNSNNSFFNPMSAAGGAIGAGLGSLFSNYHNPADSAMGYYNQIPGVLGQYLSPYINAGTSMMPGLQQQYSSLMNDPSGRLNQIGAGYQQSPGLKFSIDQALQGAGHAAAAGGMAGTPQHTQQNMQLATNLANQDYNQYMQNALGLYGQGMQGAQGMYNTGAQTGINMGEDLASLLAQQGNLAYEGQNAQNMNSGGSWGSIFGGIGSMLPFLF